MCYNPLKILYQNFNMILDKVAKVTWSLRHFVKPFSDSGGS